MKPKRRLLRRAKSRSNVSAGGAPRARKEEPHVPTAAPILTSGPLTVLVDDKLNRSLADRIVEELEEKREEPTRSGVSELRARHGRARR